MKKPGRSRLTHLAVEATLETGVNFYVSQQPNGIYKGTVRYSYAIGRTGINGAESGAVTPYGNPAKVEAQFRQMLAGYRMAKQSTTQP